MIEDPILMSNPELRHGFFTRRGGWSGGIYESLNCGYGSKDDRVTVARNRVHVATALGMVAETLVVPHQTHSADAVILDAVPADPPRADGLVSATPGVALGILSADCAPVLFADPDAPVVAAAHAGWRGALDGILDATVAAMESAGARRERIAAAVGPTIQQAAYEVGPEFRDRFVSHDPGNDGFFVPSQRAEHFLFDLPGYCARRLTAAGIANVAVSASCTYHDARNFFSYRRSMHREEPDYGRQISAITLGPSGFTLARVSGPG